MDNLYIGRDCPYGGQCIDPGNPSDCEANSCCVNFSTVEERQAFDTLPDQYYFKYPEGGEVKFKNKNQLRFLLTDLPQSVKEKAQWGTINSAQNSLEFDDA